MMTRFVGWIAPAVVGVAAWIALIWAVRPTWGYCVDGIDAAHSHCDDGVFSLGAQIATAGLVLLVLAFVVLVLVVRGPGRRRVLAIAVIVLAVACLGGLALVFAPLEEIPVTIVD